MLDRLLDLGYPMHRIFDKHTLNQLPAQHRPRSVNYHDLGWDTNSVNRPTLIFVLAEAILEHSIETHDAVTIDEYRHFCTNSDGKDEAEPGYHDDCVIADAQCVLGIRVAPRSGLVRPSLLPRKYGQVETEAERAKRVAEIRRTSSLLSIRRR